MSKYLYTQHIRRDADAGGDVLENELQMRRNLNEVMSDRISSVRYILERGQLPPSLKQRFHMVYLNMLKISSEASFELLGTLSGMISASDTLFSEWETLGGGIRGNLELLLKMVICY